MLALSIRQPWAWLILHAGKDVENRTWPTRYRGRVWIHAGKGCTRREWAEAAAFAAMCGHWITPPLEDLPRGGIVGSVVITGCKTAVESPWFAGPWGFTLERPEAQTFRPCDGRLGFFEP
ncbi:MAG: ASCH domain-containing protein [Rubrivivax sp.]